MKLLRNFILFFPTIDDCMMGIQLHLILTTCMVNFVLTSDQPQSHTTHQAVSNKIDDENGIQENLRNLFDSISKNNIRKSEVYHEILQQDAAKERQAYGVMREELRILRNKNIDKKINFLQKSNASITAAKRETKEYNFDDPAQLEDSFVGKFGDEQQHFNTWDLMRQWYYMGGRDALRRFCRFAHKEAGMGEVTVLSDSMVTWPRTLNFRNKKYFPTRIDVVKYGIEESGLDNHGENPFYITRGLRPDCAYYLRQWKTDPHRYYLTKHVCGINVHAGRDVVHW